MSPPRQMTLGFTPRPALGREDFLVAPSNAEAVAWLDRWPDWRAGALVIHGPSGCGKTHLSHVWQAASGACRVETGALARAPARDRLARSACWVIDDADAGLDEAALLHLLNAAQESGGSLLLTALAPPARWRVALPDLASRLKALPAVGLGPPDDRLLAALLVKHFADRQLRVGDGVVDYLLSRMERSFASVRRLAGALDAASLAEHRRVTVPLARKVLESLDSGPGPGAST